MFLYIFFFYCWEFHTCMYWILVKYSYFFLINCYSIIPPFFFSNFTCSLFFKSIEFIYWCLYMHNCETICRSTGSLPGTSYLQVSSEKLLLSHKMSVNSSLAGYGTLWFFLLSVLGYWSISSCVELVHVDIVTVSLWVCNGFVTPDKYCFHCMCRNPLHLSWSHYPTE